VVAGFLATGWWFGLVGDRIRTGGPLDDGDGSSSVWFYEAREGAVFSDGLEILINQGSKPVTITSVDVHGGDKALEFLGARIGLPGRPDDFNQNMKGFPPRAVPAKFQVSAVGTVLEPHESYMLILGYRVVDEVMDRRRNVSVDYEVDGDRYHDVLQTRLVACPPPLTDHTCANKLGY
jgi:hypothetical protein